MKNQAIFERYIQLADLLGQMFHNVLEVVVHDFSDLDHAILHIVNGHLSGRTTGGPVSEINLRRLLDEDQFPDQLVCFSSRSIRSQPLKSSSLAIRDDKGKLIGAFCLHFDLSQFEQFHKFLEFFINTKVDPLVGVNDFGQSVPQDAEIAVELDTWLLDKSLLASQLTYKDKQSIVEYLDSRGCFKKRGAIATVAHLLQVTRQCVYNYLELARKRR